MPVRLSTYLEALREARQYQDEADRLREMRDKAWGDYERLKCELNETKDALGYLGNSYEQAKGRLKVFEDAEYAQRSARREEEDRIEREWLLGQMGVSARERVLEDEYRRRFIGPVE